MFDLQSALSAWRREMASHEVMGVEELAELESHLLEDFDALCAGGHEAADAFDLAARRLGSCASLHAEFAKRDPRGLAHERALWALLGILAWMLLSGVWGLVAGNAGFFLSAALPEGWRGGSWLYGEDCLSEGYAIVLALVDLAFLYLVLRWLESPRSSRWLFRLRRVTQHPVRFAVLVVAALVVLTGVRWPINHLLVHMYMPEVFGHAALLSMFKSGILVLLQPLIIGSFLLRWRNAIRTDEDRKSAGDERIAPVPAACFWMLLGMVGYRILGSVLSVLQALLNVSWLSLRPGSWPLQSWLYDDRYRFSEVEASLLVLLPLAALLLLTRTLSLEWIRDRVRWVLHLMLRRRRFWAVYLLLCWLPVILQQATRFFLSHSVSMLDLARFSILSRWTNQLLALALLVGVMVTFLLLVKRRGPGTGGELECTR